MCYHFKKKVETSEIIQNIENIKGPDYEQLVRMPELERVECRKDCNNRKRINLIVPSINQEHVFGGIATGLRFFEKIIQKKDIDGRIILTQIEPDNPALEKFKKYLCVNMGDNNDSKFQIVFLNDRREMTLAVRKDDIFLATAWWTAYNAYEILQWQKTNYQFCHELIYLIQDYEPGFYAWSSRYALADVTYRNVLPTIAVFNSKELYDFFKKNGYQFEKKFYFNPILNNKLKQVLKNTEKMPKRKKQILIYGRPSTPRNCFEIIIEALEIWSKNQENVREWSIFSVGEKHPNIKLQNGVSIISLGKLTLEEYANLMMESYAGISLMLSPHPSYPPLEMATFGMKVITNKFANKNLSAFSVNITSVDNCEPEIVSKELVYLCNLYDAEEVSKIFGNNYYVNCCEEFPFLQDLEI